MLFNLLYKKISLIVISLIIMICLFSIVSIAKESAKIKEKLDSNDWTQWRGPNHDGISNEKGWSTIWPKEGPKQLWKLAVGIGYSSVAVSNGRVYTLGNINKTDTVYCLDANTGKEIWKYSYPCVGDGQGYPGPSATPTVEGKFIYTLSREGDLFCFDDSGKVIWSKKLQNDYGAKAPSWQFATSPIIYGKMLIMEAGLTIAVDKTNGNLIWKTEKDYGGGYSAPHIFKSDNLDRLAVFNAFGLVILNPEDGKEITGVQWKTSYDVNAATPIVSGDKIFISSGYNVGGAVYQFSDNKLTEIWKSKVMRNHFNSCVLWQGNLYGFDESDLKCVDFQTGVEKWKQGGLGKGSLMIADGKLIIQSESGDLAIAEANPSAYKEIARAKILTGLCWTVPVLSNGKIYCRNHEGDLVCLDVKEAKASTMGNIKKK